MKAILTRILFFLLASLALIGGSTAYAQIAITDSAPNIAQGTSYNHLPYFSASGGTAPYTFSVAVTGGPAASDFSGGGGYVFNSDGTLSGLTCLANGNFTYTVTVTDSASGTATLSGANQVNRAPNGSCGALLTVAAQAPTGTTVGGSYSQQTTVSDGTGPYTYTLDTGSLPPGTSLNGATGFVTGTPTTAGTYTYTIRVTDSRGNTGTASVTVTITNPATITINTTSLNAMTVSTPFSQTISTTPSSGTLSSCAVTAGTIPAGLALNTSTCTVSGTPTTAGPYSFTVTATASTGATASRTYTGTVQAAVAVGPSTLPAGTVGTAYSQTVTATGGTGTGYTYAVSAGSLPAGLTLNASTGVISGTPTTAGTSNFTIQATDSGGNVGTRAYTVNIAAAATISITTPALNPMTVGTPFSQTIGTSTSSGGLASCVVSSGTIPAGMTLDTSTCTISGTPTTAGPYNFTITATSTTGATTSQTFSGTVQAAVAVGPASLPTGTAGTAYNQTVTATGGTGTGYVYAVSAGSLPAGLTLNASTGVISGTPTTAGASNFTIQATDSGGNVGTRAYTVNIAAPATIAITTPVLNPMTVGVPFSETIGTAPSTGSLASCVLTSGTIPAGMTLDTSTCTLSGSPTTAGPYNFTVTATSSTGATAAQTFSGIIQASVSVGPATLPAATNGSAYSATVVATGGTGTGYTYALTSGALPAGLSLNASTGVISGTPSSVGTYNFTVEATDSAGNKGSRAYALVLNPGAILTVGPATLPAGMVGIAYSQSITATGGTGPYTCSISAGSLPPGLLLNATTCAITGKPTASGTFNFTVRVQDKDGNWGTRAYALLVNDRPDPSKDAEVIGQIGGQFAAATRFAQGQVDNVMRHLESQRSDKCGVSNSLALPNGSRGKVEGSRAELNAANEKAAKDRSNTDPTLADWLCQQERPVTLWLAGSLDQTHAGAQRFSSDGLTAGLETQFGTRVIGGVALGLGLGDTKVGKNGTRSIDSAQSGLLYLTADLHNKLALDAILGYQGVSFDTTRFVTPDGSFAKGTRDGHSFVMSLGLHGNLKSDRATLTPYVRLDQYKVDLDAYTETGSSPFILGYGAASQSSTMGLAGLRVDYGVTSGGTTFRPMARLEWRHRFGGSYDQAMWYADLPATQYTLSAGSNTTDALSAGVGLGMQHNGLSAQLEVGTSSTSLSSFKGAQVSLTLRHDLR